MKQNEKKSSLLILLILLLYSGCAPVIVLGPSYPQEPQKSYIINIPKGHLPPPGHCRIWYPDREPGQQPPPQRCPIANNNIPPGTYVISRIEDDNNQVLVNIYHEQKSGVIVDTQYLSIK